MNRARRLEGVLGHMGQRLRHRGPNAMHNWAGDAVSFGMTRLSIIDLESGVQPFWNQDHSVGVVFNGEIYNHRELRGSLEKEGVIFQSDHADGEVIVHLYEKLGLDFVRSLRGMFGISIWDSRRNQIHLVRDRSGIKPLFYYRKGNDFAFGSEIKALLELPWVSKAPNLTSISSYFSNKNISRPNTAFEDIFEVMPGNLLSFSLDSNSISQESYWAPVIDINNEFTREDWVEAIRKQFIESVILHTESDVEFGAYLSGGVDSSAVVGALVRHGSQKLKTFTLVYDDDFSGKQTDREFAKKVANKYGTEHYERVLRPQDVVSGITSIVDSFDEPFSGVFSTYFLSGLISDHVKVALSGDGADELYGSYFFHRVARLIRDGKTSAKGVVEKLVTNGLSEYQAKSLVQSNGFKDARFQWGVFDENELSTFLKGDLKASFLETVHSVKMREESYSSLFYEEPLNETLKFDFLNLLPDQVLTFVDRLSMAHSLEVRPPFLDHKFIEQAFTVPGKYKIENGRVKSVLKDALDPLLIPEILDRPKEGFVLPLNQWFEKDLSSWKNDIISLDRIKAIGLFDAKAALDSVNRHSDHQNEYGKRALNLIMFVLWWEKYFS